jgi:Rod binding domain-containing protein
MSPIDPTSTLGTEPLTPPPGVKLDTPEQEQLYRATLEFERVFVQMMLKPMEKAGSMFGDVEGGSGATSGYGDIAKDQMTQAVLDGGGLGLAASMYGQMAEAMGIAGTKAATPAATTTTPAAAPATDGGAA